MVGLADAVEELCPDDAAAAPDGGQRSAVDVPAVLGAAGGDLIESLGVGDDLGGVEGGLDVVDEGLAVGGGRAEVARRQAARGDALIGGARQGAGEHGLGDTGRRDAQVECGLHGPATGALLTRGVDDDVDQRLAGLVVDLAEDLRGDLDQVALEFGGVPVTEDVGDLRDRHVQGLAHEVVGLADELHVGVLDAVVHHLDEVAAAVGPDVGAARLAVDLGGDRLEEGPERLVGLGGSARHDRRAVERALFAAGDARADEVESAGRHRGLAPDGVGVEGVAAVDDDVARLHRVGEFLDDRVGRVARLHHDEDPARTLECGHELGHRLGADEVAVAAVVFEQRVGLGDAAVVQRDRIPVTGEVACDVRTHDGQAGDTDLGLRGGGRCVDIVHADSLLPLCPKRRSASTCDGGPIPPGDRSRQNADMSRLSSVSHGIATARVGRTRIAAAAM